MHMAPRFDQCATVLVLLVALQCAIAEYIPAGDPTIEVINGAEVIWQQPEGTPKAMLLIAHASNRAHTDFWPKSAVCPQCWEYPEEVSIVRQALAQGYTVAAVKSRDLMWSGIDKHFPESDADVVRVKGVLDVLRPRLGLDEKPIFALGFCTGHNFLIVFTLVYRFTAIAGQLGSPVPEVPMCTWSPKCATLSAPIDQPMDFPPSFVSYMTRDIYGSDHVNHWTQYMAERGVRVQVLAVPPHRVNADLLRMKIPKISEAAADDLMVRFVNNSMIGKDGFTIGQTKVASSCALYESDRWSWDLDADPASWKPGNRIFHKEGWAMHQVIEVLNVAHACHETDGASMKAILSWFESAPAASPAKASGAATKNEYELTMRKMMRL